MSNEDVNENKYKNERKRFHSRDENLSAYMQEKKPHISEASITEYLLISSSSVCG